MPRIKATESSDPDFHRSNLKKYFSSTKRLDKKLGKNYESFIKKLLEIFTDNPPTSWRFIITSYKYPGFRVVNRKSGRTTYFLRVPNDRLIIPHSFFDEQFRHLFPINNGFYGTANEVVIDFSRFGEKKQQQYIEAIKTMVTNTKLVSLNFAAHL